MSVKSKVCLVPVPTDDPRDPLNWSSSKRYCMLAALTITGFAMTGCPTSNQLAFNVQALTFQKTPLQLSYTASAAIAGFIAGPLLYPALFMIFSKPTVLFWGVIAQLLTQIWAARMTSPSDYNALIVSRLFSGMLAVLPISIGNSYILEAYFLHQRGKLFALFELVFLFGVSAIPTIGGFILNNRSLEWPWVFWWTCPLLGLAAVLVFLFVFETNFDRRSGTSSQLADAPWISNRFITFFLGWRVVSRSTYAEMMKRTMSPLIIAATPVAMISGFYNLIAFGFSIMVQLLLNISLQTPTEAGGYGFTPLQNALFLFTSWIGLGTAEVTGLLLNDRIPLWVTRRRGGVWQPEHRLSTLLIPVLLLPIGLGVYGAGLQYHLHYMVLALGQFLVQYSAQLSVPICNNYAIECFVDHAVETTVAMNIWRLALGLALPFAAAPWIGATGVGWVFGVAAFLAVFAGLLILLLAWKGQTIRGWSAKYGLPQHSEGGTRIVEKGEISKAS